MKEKETRNINELDDVMDEAVAAHELDDRVIEDGE